MLDFWTEKDGGGRCGERVMEGHGTQGGKEVRRLHLRNRRRRSGLQG